jgi:hypothetical protein
MRARGKRAVVWSPLSPEARALIDEGERFTWRAWRDGVLIAERVGVALREEVERVRQVAAREGWTFEADDGLAWGYVSLSDGAAAQRCAFGVAQSPPDLFTVPQGVEPS